MDEWLGDVAGCRPCTHNLLLESLSVFLATLQSSNKWVLYEQLPAYDRFCYVARNYDKK